MKHKLILVWGVLWLIISCAGIEPARVENGLYINPTYQFSLRVPDGWEVSEEIPEFIKKGMSIVSSKKFKATFSDLNNKSFILVSAEPAKMDWASFKMYSDKFISSLDENLEKQKKKFLEDPRFRDYRYEIYNDQIENCNNDCIATKIDFHVQDLKVTGHHILYESKSGMFHSTFLVFVAREKQHATNLKIFKKVVDSFH